MKARNSGFTLIELLIVIAIVGMLVALATPAAEKVIEKADSVKCASNLRTVGGAVHLYAVDHNNHFPMIEGLPSSPIYSEESGAGTLLEVLGPYGISAETLRCPADIKKNNYYAKEGSSYMWRPLVDDELTTAPRIYHPRRGEIVPPPERLRLLSDYFPNHAHHVNCLMADGHVRMF